MVEILMQHGTDPTLTNKWGHTPKQEPATPQIKKIIELYEADKMCQILECLMQEKSLSIQFMLLTTEGRQYSH